VKRGRPAGRRDRPLLTHTSAGQEASGSLGVWVSKGPVATPGGPSAFHLIVTLTFDKHGRYRGGVRQPEGKATAADVPKFASGGVEMNFFETREV